MLDTGRLIERLSDGRGSGIELGPEPTKEEIRDVVKQFKADGLCGRRVGENRLVPHFLASDDYGQREISVLEEVLAEEYEGSDRCVRTRRSECSRLRGGCKGSR